MRSNESSEDYLETILILGNQSYLVHSQCGFGQKWALRNQVSALP